MRIPDKPHMWPHPYNGTALYFALQVRQAWAVWDRRWLAGSEQLLEQSQRSYGVNLTEVKLKFSVESVT